MADPVNVEVVRSVEALEPVLARWTSLERTGAVRTPFQRVAWLRSWLRGPGAGCDPFVLHLPEHGILAPLQRVRSGGGVLLRFLGHRVSDYEDLVHAGPRAQAWERVAHALMEQRREWDVLALDTVPDAREVERILLGIGGRVDMTPHDECPALDLSHASFEEWLQTKSPKFRRNVRKTERDLVARGAVEVRCLRPPLHAAQLDELAAVERASWKGSHGQLFFGDARKAILLREFLADPDSTARVYVLHVDAEAAAFAIVHCDERAWYYYWGAYRQHHPNAGGTLLGRIVQDAFAQRVPAFDFLLGSEGFKRFWASRSREVHHVTWSHGARGRLLAGAITMRRALGRSALVERLRELRRGGSIGRRPEPQAGAGASARED